MITLAVKSQFFDRQVVIDAVGRASAQALAKAGAFIRTGARSSMKRRKASAPPGMPPSVHAPSGAFASLRNILFAFDPATKSMVIGPVALNQLSFSGNRPVSGTVPTVQEFGGDVGEFQFQRRNGSWNRADLRSRRRFAGRPTRIRRIHVRPHPFMKPAMDRELPKFPALWKNSVVRGT